MNARDLVASLQLYHGRFSLERSTVDRFLRLLSESSPSPNSCFERRYFTPGHLTGSAWLVDRSRDKALLTHHRKLGRWMQLGGHADGDDDILRVALREAHEESGLLEIRPLSTEIYDLDIHTIPARGEDPEHLHFDVRFLLEADSNHPLHCSDESHEIAWVALDSIPTFTKEESVLRLVRKTPSPS